MQRLVKGTEQRDRHITTGSQETIQAQDRIVVTKLT